jgi:hypothetical protein
MGKRLTSGQWVTNCTYGYWIMSVPFIIYKSLQRSLYYANKPLVTLVQRSESAANSGAHRRLWRWRTGGYPGKRCGPSG